MDFDALMGIIGGRPNDDRPMTNPIQAILQGGHHAPLPPGTISEAGAMPGGQQLPSYGGQEPDATVTGDGWKPKHRSTLGTIADILFGLGGGPAVFANRIKQKNINSAMEGITQDPMRSINRLSRIPGMGATAWQMYDKEADNQRASDIAKMRKMDYEDSFRAERIAPMLAVADSPEKYAKLLPTMRRMMESRGMDPTELPDVYDPDVVDMFRHGGMKVDQQEDNKRDAVWKSERLRQYDDAEAGRNTRFQEKETNDLTQLDIVEGNKDKRQVYHEDRADSRKRIPTANAKTGGGEKYVRNEKGDVVGRLNPAGTIAEIKAPDGGFQYFEVVNGKLGKRVD